MNRDEKIALCKIEHGMTVEDLKNKYGTEDSWGHHPVYTRADWRRTVANDETLLGYWESVYNQIDLIACGIDELEEDDE